MEPIIQKVDPKDEFFIDEGCYILELSYEDDPSLSIARARVLSGVTTKWHRLVGIVERYVMVEGTGMVEVGTQAPELVGPGDVVHIPPLCPQRITNIGSKDLIFLAVCSPRFVSEAYEDLETD